MTDEVMVEIGGQVMTQAQFDAARFPLLAAAADAPQPATCDHGKTEPHRIPAPWHDDPSAPRVYHCPGPSPAVLPEPDGQSRSWSDAFDSWPSADR